MLDAILLAIVACLVTCAAMLAYVAHQLAAYAYLTRRDRHD